MKSGLLWYDNSIKPLAEKIADAARRYQEKYGTAPNTVYVNPNEFGARDTALDPQDMIIGAKPTIMRNHIWLGVDEALRAFTADETE